MTASTERRPVCPACDTVFAWEEWAKAVLSKIRRHRGKFVHVACAARECDIEKEKTNAQH